MLRKRPLVGSLRLFSNPSNKMGQYSFSCKATNKPTLKTRQSKSIPAREKPVNQRSTSISAKHEIANSSKSSLFAIITLLSLGSIGFSSFFSSYVNKENNKYLAQLSKEEREKLKREEQIIEFIIRDTKGEAALCAYKTPSFGSCTSTFWAIDEQKMLRQSALALYQERPGYWDVRMAIASEREREFRLSHTAKK